MSSTPSYACFGCVDFANNERTYAYYAWACRTGRFQECTPPSHIMRLLTCSCPDDSPEPPVDDEFPIVNDVIVLDTGKIQIQGLFYLTNTTGPVDRFLVIFDDSTFVNFYDPAGPNAGLNPVGTTITNYIDTSVDIDNTIELSGKTIASISVQDFFGNYFINYDIIPDVVVP